MHNGLIGNWSRLRRRVESLIPDEVYGSRIGTTNSEAVFLAMLGAGGDKDPIGATKRRARDHDRHGSGKGYKEPLRFTAALANGRDLYAFRYSANDNANSLYYQRVRRQRGGRVRAARRRARQWKPVPPGHVVDGARRQASRARAFPGASARWRRSRTAGSAPSRSRTASDAKPAVASAGER